MVPLSFFFVLLSISIACSLVAISAVSLQRSTRTPSLVAFLNPGVFHKHLSTTRSVSPINSSSRHNALVQTRMSADADQTGWRGAAAISKLTESTNENVFDVEKIKSILPHRFPFLLVDKVLEFQPGERAVGVKQITMNEDQFNGHFPQRAVMPGVLQIEALAQLGGIVALQEPVSDGKGIFFFAGVNGVKWKRPVVPGDTLVMEVELTTWKPKFGIAKMAGRGYVNGQLAIDVKEMTFAVVQ